VVRYFDYNAFFAPIGFSYRGPGAENDLSGKSFPFMEAGEAAGEQPAVGKFADTRRVTTHIGTVFIQAKFSNHDVRGLLLSF
jgi:hypothetical protein